VELRWLGPDDVDLVVAASPLFDGPADAAGAADFLARPLHHLCVALDGGVPVGFVSGVETTHPDKGTELFLYELAVDEAWRRRGIGRALVDALAGRARELGCYGMWVATEPGNEAAIATYRAAGSDEPEPTVVLSWTFR
jgi:ribosomal protein S18 acetylase RimI-like enzyme